MPGIVGIIAPGGAQQREAELRVMVQSMMHEPFYRSGVHSEASLQMSAGWSRARVHSLTGCLYGINAGISA